MSSEPTNQRGPLQALGLGFHVEAGWVFAALPVEILSAGLETNIDETRSAVTAIPPLGNFNRTGMGETGAGVGL